jgi:ABC-type nitrate/sulfonate/bicarbonate transport system permease component
MSRIVSRIANIWIAALYPLAKISLIPLLIIWLGSGAAYRIVISAARPQSDRAGHQQSEG